ncbi:MAG TPA: hypothetical protein VFE88_01550 [Candidatus Nanoarchaeia archaeon]|nr:hypothetical protein [Candidatus Nanoarchaeia archaeon]
MHRKVVKHGPSTLSVSLPSKWVKTNKIKNGQTLNLEATSEGLLIYFEKEHFDKIETSLSSDKEWYVYRILRHLYTYGYDEVKINYTKKEYLSLVRKRLDSLTGFDVIESNQKYCRLKCIVSAPEQEYKQIVERIMWLILSQFDYLIEDAKNKKPTMYDEINEIFKSASRFNNLCRRLINKKSPYDAVTSKYVYTFLTTLLNISSFITYSYEYVKKADKLELTHNELDLILKTRAFYNNLFLAYMNLDVEKTRLFFEERDAMFDDILEVLKEKNPVISHYFLNILKELSSIGNLILILKINEENQTPPI